MSEEKKDGFFKRIFGGKKEGCCGIKIEEVLEESAQKETETTESPGCCSPGKQTAP